MLDTERLGALIREKRGDLSLRDCAKSIGISHTHLDSIEKGYDPRTGKPVSLTVETLHKISQGMNIPIEDLMSVLGVSQLTHQSTLTAHDERDIAKDMERLREKLSTNQAAPLSYNGTELDDNSRELLLAEVEIMLRRLKVENKEKYNPNKNKKG